MAAIQRRYGPLPPPDDEEGYRRALREQTYRVYKRIEAKDPSVARYLAEHDQMRAYAVAFLLLTGVAIGSAPVSGGPRLGVHLATAVGYAALTALAVWRMRDKDETLGVHVLNRYLEAEREEAQ